MLLMITFQWLSFKRNKVLQIYLKSQTNFKTETTIVIWTTKIFQLHSTTMVKAKTEYFHS